MKGRNSSFCLVGKEGPSSEKNRKETNHKPPHTHFPHSSDFRFSLLFHLKKKKKEKLSLLHTDSSYSDCFNIT